MKLKNLLISLNLILSLLLTGCAGSLRGETPEKKPEAVVRDTIVVGFSQLGAESDWRSTNTRSMKETLTKENGFDLIIKDGQQKQANQIRAIRTFIQQEVDYIVLAPVTETGWDTVLEEARDAKIPVIIVDRMVDVADQSLFTCWVGSDFELEGKKVAEWLNQFTSAKGISPEELHIVNIQGTLGASAQLGRTKGLRDAADKYGWDLMAEVTGEFTQTKGKEVMEALLKEHDNINVVYCENDNEALGVIEAIEEAGKTAGTDIASGDILILSFDGVNEAARRYVLEGKIACIAECNPHHGPRVQAIINKLAHHEMPEKLSFVDESFYAYDDTVTSLTVGSTAYPIVVITEEILNNWEN